MIDLHLHTTASDGTCDPATLVRRARDAGITTLSVTDHDTSAGLAEAAEAAARHGLEFVPGIEITAVHDDHDVHVLGYFFDGAFPPLAAFLAAQRADRVRRVLAMADRLTELGRPIDREPLIRQAQERPDASVGRPLLAQALVRAGHVATVRQAFDELLGEGRPAYMPRHGGSPAEVVHVITEAGGIASLAHPGLFQRDELIAPLASQGLVALEAFHSDHDPVTTEHYIALARRLGLAVSGGSDYHGQPDRRHDLGLVSLPRHFFRDLAERAKAVRSSKWLLRS